MTRLRGYLVVVGLWLARLGGWQETERLIEKLVDRFPINDEILVSARMLVAHVEKNFAGHSGEFKRSQVLRALMNRHPGVAERDLSLHIEAAVRE